MRALEEGVTGFSSLRQSVIAQSSNLFFAICSVFAEKMKEAHIDYFS
jgi:hypothetical protein